MLFGSGISLTPEEDALLHDVVYPCHVALALTNDYFSFDREYDEHLRDPDNEPTNGAWLFMKWRGVDVATAKDLLRQAAIGYERQFLQGRVEFLRRNRSPKLARYLQRLEHMVSGNVVWSLNCPRYHPAFRYHDPNAGIEGELTARLGGLPQDRVREMLPGALKEIQAAREKRQGDHNDGRSPSVSGSSNRSDSDSKRRGSSYTAYSSDDDTHSHWTVDQASTRRTSIVSAGRDSQEEDKTQ